MENYALEELLCTTTVQRSVPVSKKYTKKFKEEHYV